MELPTVTITREPTLGTNSLLLIDDEPHVLAVGKAILSSQGFSVVCATSGEQALDLIRHANSIGKSYSVALLDLTMPGGASGFDVLEMIRAVNTDLPVIACSGYFQEDARELCQAIGFYDILSKPFNIETLAITVRRAINGEAAPRIVAAPAFASAPITQWG